MISVNSFIYSDFFFFQSSSSSSSSFLVDLLLRMVGISKLYPSSQAIQNEDNDKEEEEWAARLRVGGAALSRLRASLAWSLLQILLNNPT
jgi:hypothetical protein